MGPEKEADHAPIELVDTTGLLGLPGGAAALRQWCVLWALGEFPRLLAPLWTAATVVALDGGPMPQQPGQPAPPEGQRKLRPIALAEALLKLAEGVIIDQHIWGLRRAVEPRQLGAGTPDGCVLVVKALRLWQHNAEGPTARRPRAPGTRAGSLRTRTSLQPSTLRTPTGEL